MRLFLNLLLGAVLAISLTGCGMNTIKPNYTSTNPDLMRIGGDKPTDKEPETVNLGAYCLKVTEKWKADGKTPDDKTIWTKDTLRSVIPCPK